MTTLWKNGSKVLILVCALLIVGGVTYVFGQSNGTRTAQVKHNIDAEAHPNITGPIIGQLNMIKGDVGRLSTQVSNNAAVLNAMKIEQAEQRIVLEHIKEAVDGK